MSWLDEDREDYELRQKRDKLREELNDREIGVIAQAMVLGEINKINDQLCEKEE
jgi:hypothetical protein